MRLDDVVDAVDDVLVSGWNDGTVPISFIFDKAEIVGVGNGLMKTPATTCNYRQ